MSQVGAALVATAVPSQLYAWGLAPRMSQVGSPLAAIAVPLQLYDRGLAPQTLKPACLKWPSGPLAALCSGASTSHKPPVCL